MTARSRTKPKPKRKRKRKRKPAPKPGPPFYRCRPQVELDRVLHATVRLIDEPAVIRREACRYDPLLFATVYFMDHLRGPTTGGLVTFSEFHISIGRWAVATLVPKPVRLRQYRDAFVAPRESGKTTWLFLIVPIWAAAYEHSTFTAAFADTSTQAREHLATLRNELAGNEALQADWPDLCIAAVRTGTRRTIADRQDDIHQANGWRMVVRGADKAALGLKKGADRPDFILLDDIEPGESQYSPLKVRGRLTTILDGILPMNLAARVVLSGTVTMPGSIVHQLLQHHLVETPKDELDGVAWITDENWTVHYQAPILENPDGTERSWWPEKWSLPALSAMRHTRSYRKNMENRPLAGDGEYWTGDHFRYDQLDGYGRTILYVDPATTTKATSDWTGLAVVSLSPGYGEVDPATGRPRRRLWVRYATHVRLVGVRLAVRVQAILAEHQDIGMVVVETNAGGEYVLEALSGLGPPVVPDPATEAKTVRAERVLDLYDRGLVLHTERHTTLEHEMEAFPTPGVHDDTLDATVGAILWLLRRRRRRRQTTASQV